MVLSLINPIGPNFMKDFPAQNEVNLDRIDNYAGPCLTTHLLTPYDAQLTAVTANPTLGAGSTQGFYYKIFDQVFVWAQFRFGAGFTLGTGIYMMNLPFPAKSIIGPNVLLGSSPILGNGSVWDESSSAGRQPVVCSLRTSTQVQFVVRVDSGLAARECTSANLPITWAVDDGVSWCARYTKEP